MEKNTGYLLPPRERTCAPMNSNSKAGGMQQNSMQSAELTWSVTDRGKSKTAECKGWNSSTRGPQIFTAFFVVDFDTFPLRIGRFAFL
jgi:hypothetical protein